jgi:membrane protease YdiL (CAAX protease family)
MVLLILFYLVGNDNVPSVLVLIIVDLLITIPIILYLIAKDQGLPFKLERIHDILKQQQCVRFRTFISIVIFSLAWAIVVFQFMKPVSELVLGSFFEWMPSWFRLEDYLLHREQYSTETIRITFLLIIIASIVIPLAEEIYFRGFLMLKKEQSTKLPVLRNTILFSAYHLWSPWLFFTRVIATYPIHYFVWKRRNIFLSITIHCTLNLIGDVILVYPLIFNTQ